MKKINPHVRTLTHTNSTELVCTHTAQCECLEGSGTETSKQPVVNIMPDLPSEVVDVSATSYAFCPELLTDLGSMP